MEGVYSFNPEPTRSLGAGAEWKQKKLLKMF